MLLTSKSQSGNGFTLIEIMISATIGIAAVAGAFFVLKNQSMSEARTAGIADFESLKLDIKRILNDPALCPTALRHRDTAAILPVNANLPASSLLNSPIEIFDGNQPFISACNSLNCSDIPRYRYRSILVTHIKAVNVATGATVHPGNLREYMIDIKLNASIPGEVLGQSVDSSSMTMNGITSMPVLHNNDAPIRYWVLANAAIPSVINSCLYRETNVTACVTPADQSPAPTAPANGSIFVFVGAGDSKTIAFTNVGTVAMTINFAIPPGFSGPASIVVAPGAVANPAFTADLFPNIDQVITATWTAGISTGAFNYTLRAS